MQSRLRHSGGLGGMLGSSKSSRCYWATQYDVLFFGEISKITGGRLYNQKSGATDYLIVGGTAGSYTFQTPNTAPYIAADTDYIWFKTDTTQRTTTEAELIGYDFTRTIVKYEDVSDYSIEVIMILSSNVDTSKMRDDFHLSIWWDNILNSHGSSKDNRGIGQSIWTAESVFCSQYQTLYNALTTKPSDAIAGYQDTFVRSLVTGGVWAKHDVIVILAQTVNTAGEAFKNWIDVVNHDATDVGGTTFTALEGITFTTGTKYLNTHWNAAHGPNYVRNSASFWRYSRNTNPASGSDMGSYQTGVNYLSLINGINGTCYINSNVSCALGAGNDTGFILITRTGASNVSIYRNKVKTDIAGNNSNGVSALDFYVGCVNLNDTPYSGCPLQFSAYGMGAALSEAEENCLYDALQAYMTSIGKQV